MAGLSAHSTLLTAACEFKLFFYELRIIKNCIYPMISFSSRVKAEWNAEFFNEFIQAQFAKHCINDLCCHFLQRHNWHCYALRCLLSHCFSTLTRSCLRPATGGPGVLSLKSRNQVFSSSKNSFRSQISAYIISSQRVTINAWPTCLILLHEWYGRKLRTAVSNPLLGVFF